MNLVNDEAGDAELLERIKKGEEHSFRILVNRHSRRCYRLAYRILANKELAEDTVQEVMLKIWTKPFLWQEGRGGKFTTWLYRVVFNAALDSYRKNKRKRAVAIEDWEDILESPQSQHKDVEWEKLAEIIQQQLMTLSMNQRLAIVLCRLEGMSYKDAGTVLNISPKAVDGCINRGINELKSKLNRDGIDITEVF